MGTEKAKMGRPTKYKEEYNDEAFKLCVNAYTNNSLAAHFGIGHTTFRMWMNTYPKFRASVESGKSEADQTVVRSLYDLATQSEPDIRAIQFWLRNRKTEFGEKTFVDSDIKPDASTEDIANGIIAKVASGEMSIEDGKLFIEVLKGKAYIEEGGILQREVDKLKAKAGT